MKATEYAFGQIWNWLQIEATTGGTIVSWLEDYRRRSKEAWDRGAKRGWRAAGGKADRLQAFLSSNPKVRPTPQKQGGARGTAIVVASLMGLLVLLGIISSMSSGPPKSATGALSAKPAIAAASDQKSKDSDNPLHLPPLPKAERFSGYALDHPLRPAEDALNNGDIGRAYNLFAARDQSKDGPLDRKFDDVLEAAFGEWSKNDPASDFADRVEHYWIPAAQKLAAPTDVEGWPKLLIDIDELATNFSDCEHLKLSAQQRIVARRFSRLLGDKQRQLFPAIRRQLASQMDTALFRNDTRVEAIGKRAEVLRFTGPQYARNAAIADMEEGAGSNFLKSRYHRVDYRWSHYFNDGSHYDLSVPSDAAIAVWDGGSGKLRVIKCGLS